MEWQHESDASPDESWPGAGAVTDDTEEMHRTQSDWLGALVAWVIILGAVTLVVAMPDPPPKTRAQPAPSMQDHIVSAQARVILMLWRAGGPSRATAMEMLHNLDSGPVVTRLRRIALMSELTGRASALAELDDLAERASAQGVELTSDERSLFEVLRGLWELGAGGAGQLSDVDDEARELVIDRLGWCGRLALAPDTGDAGSAGDFRGKAERDALLDEAARYSAIAIAVFVIALLYGLAGVIVLVGFALPRLVGWFLAPRPAATQAPRRSGVYAETLALWFVLFSAINVACGAIDAINDRLVALIVAFPGAVAVALLWPRLRGIPFAEMREAIGWTGGRRRLVDPLVGLLVHAACIPVLIAAAAVVVHLGLGGSPQPSPNDFTAPPEHDQPHLDFAVGGNTTTWMLIFILAAVVAPVTEEVMFRGVLFAHLRGGLPARTRRFNVCLSVFLTSVIFAVIHHYGATGTVVLAILASGFAIAREWRGSLVPGMVAHSVHNGAAVGILFLLLGS